MEQSGRDFADGTVDPWQALRSCYAAYVMQATEKDNDWWNSLTQEDQLKAFRCICRRIYEGDVKRRGSYRYVLYQVFGFGLDAYGDGLECGYMAIHNLIYEALENEKTSDDA